MHHYWLGREIESHTHGEKDTNPRKNKLCRGKGLEIMVKSLWLRNTELDWTYETGAGADDCVGRDSVQPIDNRRERLDQLEITIPELTKGLGLRFEYSENGIGRLAFIDLGSQRVAEEILSSALGILSQGYVEEGLEVG